jgi:hypothetical protein
VRIVFPGGFLATSGTLYLLRHGLPLICLVCSERKVPPQSDFLPKALDPSNSR